jgi:hypothetical protein
MSPRANPRMLVLLLALSAILGVSWAAEPQPQPPETEATQTEAPAREPMTAEDIAGLPKRFDHSRHVARAQKAGRGCEACHELPTAEAPSPTLTPMKLTPMKGACHGCHKPPDGERAWGPRRCRSCHDDVPPPGNHGAGWLDVHGADARLTARVCTDCHRARFCVDCHERKDSIRMQVHDRTWLSVHGIAVRVDPTACSSCHLQSDCITCHAAGARVP